MILFLPKNGFYFTETNNIVPERNKQSDSNKCDLMSGKPGKPMRKRNIVQKLLL